MASLEHYRAMAERGELRYEQVSPALAAVRLAVARAQAEGGALADAVLPAARTVSAACLAALDMHRIAAGQIRRH